MTLDDFISILPKPEQSSINNIKDGHPYAVLLNFSKALHDSYRGKISSYVSESSDVIKDQTIDYSLYVTADIGNGFAYKLLELEPKSFLGYPIDIKLYEFNNTRPVGVAKDHEELVSLLKEIIRSSFFAAFISNLIAQVDLHKKDI